MNKFKANDGVKANFIRLFNKDTEKDMINILLYKIYKLS
jgi:hypothetical protein